MRRARFLTKWGDISKPNKYYTLFDLVLYIIKTQILYKLRVRNPFIINTDIVKSLYFATLDAILLWKVDCLWKL